MVLQIIGKLNGKEVLQSFEMLIEGRGCQKILNASLDSHLLRLEQYFLI